MVSLTLIRISLSFWKKSLRLSKRLSGRTWVTLAIINATIAIGSFLAYQAKTVPESAIPPVKYIALTTTTDQSWSQSMETFTVRNQGSCTWFAGSVIHISEFSAIKANNRYGHLSRVLYGSNFDPGYAATIHPTTQLMKSFPSLPTRNQITVEVRSPAIPSLLDAITKEVALVVSIVTTILAIMNGFFAWMVYRRSKAQDILLQLQIAKLTAELAQLRAQEAKAAQEEQNSPLIILS